MRVRHVAHVNPPSRRFERLADDASVPFLPMERVWPDGRLDLSENRPKHAVASGYTRFESGDVLVPKITPTFEASRSVLVPVLPDSVGAGSTELHVVRAGSEIDRRYLLYQFHSHGFLKLGEAEMYGVAGQKRVPDDFLRDWILDLPPLNEQRRVADFLDHETKRIDDISRLQTRTLDWLALRDRAARDLLLDEMVNRVGELPLRRSAGSVEQGSSPACLNSPRSGDGWGVIKLSAIKNGRFYDSENKSLPPDTAPTRQYEIRNGDVLMTRANTPDLVGDVAVAKGVGRGLLLPDLVYRIKFNSGVRPAFAVQVLLSSRVRGLIQAAARGSSQSMVKLRGEDILALPFPRANTDDQDYLVSRLEEHLTASSNLRKIILRQLDLLTERRQALITAAVTGQIDVTTARGVAV